MGRFNIRCVPFNYQRAPIIDRIRIPWLTDKVGHRRVDHLYASNNLNMFSLLSLINQLLI